MPPEPRSCSSLHRPSAQQPTRALSSSASGLGRTRKETEGGAGLFLHRKINWPGQAMICPGQHYVGLKSARSLGRDDGASCAEGPRMNGLNKVIIMGNLGADPELRIGAGGVAILKMRVATSESWQDKEQKWQERTE